MIVIKTRVVRIARASAITFWPFLLVDPLDADDEDLLEHEDVHGHQQWPWVVIGLLVAVGLKVASLLLGQSLGWWHLGLLPLPFLWHLLYLGCLPVGWNPWRWRWEAQAMEEANGMDDEEIERRLRDPPYYLFWM